MISNDARSIVKDIVDSDRFLHVYLVGDAAADIHIAHRGLGPVDDPSRIYVLEIGTNLEESNHEAQRVASILKDILQNHTYVIPERVAPLSHAEIDGLQFDIFVNTAHEDVVYVVDGIPVLSVDGILKEYMGVVRDLEIEVSYDNGNTELIKKLDMCKKRMALLQS